MSLPLGKTNDHVLCRHGLLTHPGGRGLHTHDHTAVVVHQIVVVITEASWRATFGGISRIGISGRHLLLLMYRFFYRVLLFQFLQILAHRVMHLGRFLQLLLWNAALLRRIGFHKTTINRQVLTLHQAHFHTLPHDSARTAARTTSIPETVRAGSWRAWSGGEPPDQSSGR